jgi:drug/metabolite transporter (DMT)-like permease
MLEGVIVKMTFLGPLLTAIAGQVAYHLAQKSVPAAANPFATLSFAYLTGLISCIALAPLVGNPLSMSDVRVAYSWQTWVLGASIVAIEIGYLLAYRSGWSIGVAFAIAATTTTVLLAAIGGLWLGDTLGARRLIGLLLATGGVWLVVARR